MSGWIKIHRSMSDHWLWKDEFSFGQAWIDLILNACHKDNKVMIKGQLIELKRGQQARSEVTLAKTWCWSRNKVRRFLKNLETDSMITRKAEQHTSIITICNYSDFQDGDTTGGTPNRTPNDTQKGQVSEHQKDRSRNTKRNTNKNVKNGNNVKNEKNEKNEKKEIDLSPLGFSDFEIDEFNLIINRVGSVIDQSSVDRLADELNKSRERGISNNEILEYWSDKGWKFWKDEWIKTEDSHPVDSLNTYEKLDISKDIDLL